MRISRIQIENFRCFKKLDVNTGQNIVLVGENKAGKSNFIHAIRLILDPSISELERQLSDQDFWDGDNEKPFGGRTIKISLQFSDFGDEDQPDHLLLSLFNGTCLIQGTPQPIAQVTFVYRNVKQTDNPDKSTIDDYEYAIYGGNDEKNEVKNINIIRRNVPLEVIQALRDIASDNRVWRRSPLRRLVELSDLQEDQLVPFAEKVRGVSEDVLKLPPLSGLQNDIQNRLKTMVGELYAISPELGLSATTPAAIQEELRLFADGSKHRPLERTSLGLQNTLYLSLLSLWMEKQGIHRAKKDEKYFPIIALEEPEAHLHPHLQRLVFEYFLSQARIRRQPVIISTHSPYLASTTHIEDVVLLKDTISIGSVGKAAYEFLTELTDRERKDLQRFLDITKAELLFSKGVIFVEGDVEALLMDEFADMLGISLCKYGIAVCNISGTNFYHVVQLAIKFGVPFLVLTDGDKCNEVTGLHRGISLSCVFDPNLPSQLSRELNGGNVVEVITQLRELGIFMNEWTFEVTLLEVGLFEEVKEVFQELGAEINVRVRAGVNAVDAYMVSSTDENIDAFLTSVKDARWGKGRFAHRLITKIRNKTQGLNEAQKISLVPEYIRSGVDYILQKVNQN